MPHIELDPFIDAAKAQGASDEFLAALLTRRGWAPADVYAVLGAWWERHTGVPIPAHRSTAESSRDAFLYLLSFSTLATAASALGSLLFRLIEYWLPDPVSRGYVYNFRTTVTWQMASILVAMPIYLLVMRGLVRETAGHPERVDSGVRKWLTYIALLVTASAVICDLVVFVDYFLTGEITARFVLKCATVLAICGSIFWYYLGFLRGRAARPGFVFAAAGVSAVAVLIGLGVAGTPSVQRHIEADGKRVQDLRAIAEAVHSMTPIPAAMGAIGADNRGLRIYDPETRAPYEYRIKQEKQYELCATFAAASEGPPNNWPNSGAFWSHPQGRACFALDAGRPVPW